MAHVAGYVVSPYSRLVAVADAWDVRRERIGGTFSQGSMLNLRPLFESETLEKRWHDLGARVYRDVASVAADSDIDLVSLCTPDDLHEEHAVLLLEAGKDLIIEKPIALSLAAARRIHSAARASTRRVAVNFEMRINPGVVKLRELVTSGVLGEVQAFNLQQYRAAFRRDKWEKWIQEKSRSGGLIVEETCHWFDLARFVVGKEITAVHAVSNDRVHDDFDFEDIAYVHGEYHDGAIFQVGHALTGFDFSIIIQVHGTRGTAWCGLKAHPFSFLDGGQTNYLGVVSWGPVDPAGLSPKFITYGDEVLEARNIRDHVAECVENLVSDQPFRADLSDGLASLDVSLAASAAVSDGQTRSLDATQWTNLN